MDAGTRRLAESCFTPSSRMQGKFRLPGDIARRKMAEATLSQRRCGVKTPGQYRGSNAAHLSVDFALAGFTPIVDGTSNRLRREVTAAHLVFGDATQCIGDNLLANLIRLLHRFAQYHLC